MYYEATMEQTAVQLMSRKQRAAKLLTGEIGLTGLDALTEGEGGLEEALLAAIGRDETLLDPSELFKKSEAQGEIDSEDAAYWNVELTEPEGEPLMAEYAVPVMQIELQPALENDPLIREAIQLVGVVTEIEPEPLAVFEYLDMVHIITDDQKLSVMRAELLTLLPVSPARLCDWLRDNHVVFPGCEAEVAARIISLVQAANSDLVNVVPVRPVVVSTKSIKSAASRSRKLDLLAVPDDAPPPEHQHPEQVDKTAPLQLALF